MASRRSTTLTPVVDVLRARTAPSRTRVIWWSALFTAFWHCTHPPTFFSSLRHDATHPPSACLRNVSDRGSRAPKRDAITIETSVAILGLFCPGPQETCCCGQLASSPMAGQAKQKQA
uniref:Secreted protein n=1 Tax=Mycena chlorophos TaxID=658473 RepID=A0ABQ0MD84_MYCCL|nr:predicted protein [Mycena chlorophos]